MGSKAVDPVDGTTEGFRVGGDPKAGSLLWTVKECTKKWASSSCILRLSEAGVQHWSLEAADAKMRARGLQPHEPTRVTRLKVYDLYGGLFLSSGLLIFSLLCYALELLWKRRYR